MDNCPEHGVIQGPGYSDGQGRAEGNPLSNDSPPHDDSLSWQLIQPLGVC